MLQVIQCKCGADQMTMEWYCEQCGKDRAKGEGGNLAMRTIADYNDLPEREKASALAQIQAWARYIT